MPTDSPAVIVYNEDGYAVDTVVDDNGDRGLHTTSRFTENSEKIVGVSFTKANAEAVSSTTYYMGIDLSNTTDFKHNPGNGIKLVQVISKGFKSSASAEWSAQLLVVIRIDGTDSDLAVLAQTSLTLRDTGRLGIAEQIVNLWPNPVDLTVSGGELIRNLTNAIDFNETAINTGVTLEDAAGNSVVPAVGDVLIRAHKISGTGDLEFAFGIQYYVE
jgi:hypothetical protein